MSHSASASQGLRRLIDLGEGGSALSCSEALRVVDRLAAEVERLHRSGVIHRSIELRTVELDAHSNPRLPPPAVSRRFGGGISDPDFCPLALLRGPLIELPAEMGAARRVLETNGIPLAPEAVDVYQLGAVLCRLLTGRSVRAFMFDPAVKQQLARPYRSLLSLALGHLPGERLRTASDLQEAIAAVLRNEKARGSDEPVPSPERPALPDKTAQLSGETARTAIECGEAAEGDVPVRSSQPSVHTEASPPARLGHFRILRRIGQGGMGEVFEAFDEKLHRRVALKVLRREMAAQPEHLRRFVAEASAAAQLAHPNVAHVYSIEEAEGRHFFAMQYVDGQSLAHHLAESGPAPLERAVAVLDDCLCGLQAAHARGLIHRDVKPGNILIERDSGRAILVDFGLVRPVSRESQWTDHNTVLGTVDYIAPEQATGQTVDGRTDLYSLGVVAYQLFSGRLPFSAESPSAVLFSHAYKLPSPLSDAAPGLPPAISEFVAKLLVKEPGDRYASAAEALAHLRAIRCKAAVGPGRHPPTDTDAAAVRATEAGRGFQDAPPGGSAAQASPSNPPPADAETPVPLWVEDPPLRPPAAALSERLGRARTRDEMRSVRAGWMLFALGLAVAVVFLGLYGPVFLREDGYGTVVLEEGVSPAQPAEVDQPEPASPIEDEALSSQEEPADDPVPVPSVPALPVDLPDGGDEDIADAAADVPGIFLEGTVRLAGSVGEPSAVLADCAIEVQLLDSDRDVHEVIVPPAGVDVAKFGYALAHLDGNLLVGAPGESESPSAPRMDGKDRPGQAFVFDREGRPAHTLTSPERRPRDRFGCTVAAAGDWWVVGASFCSVGERLAGAAYVFDRASGRLLNRLDNPGPMLGQGTPWDWFGFSVAASSQSVLVGAPYADIPETDAGAAFLFDAASGGLRLAIRNEQASSFDGFGWSVALVGERLVVGIRWDDFAAEDTGRVLILDGTTGMPLQFVDNPRPHENAHFGRVLAAAADDSPWFLATAPHDDTFGPRAGAAYLFDASGELQRPIDPPQPALGSEFGRAAAMGGGWILIGAPLQRSAIGRSGAAYLFDSGSGQLHRVFHAPEPVADDQFGRAVAIDPDQQRVFVAARGQAVDPRGIVYVFDIAESPQEFRSDAAGRFVIEGLSPGHYEVRCVPPPGYRLVEGREDTVNVRLGPDQPPPPVEFLLSAESEP